MPTYEYQCRQCGERLEVFQKFSDKPLRVHPECGGQLQKVFHPSGIVFKGSGYYVTDSRSKASAPTTNGSNGAGDNKKNTKTGSDKSAKSETSGKSDTSSAAATD